MQVWLISGYPYHAFAHKVDAERAAREAFPDESPDRRYARLHYVPVMVYRPECEWPFLRGNPSKEPILREWEPGMSTCLE